MTLLPGAKLGPYEILSTLGAGGMGEVYRARHWRLERDVAIKVLPEHLVGDRDAIARFEREAKAVATLNHPNILAIHDFGDNRGTPYAVMELLEGETLRSRLSRSVPPWQKAVEIAIAVAEGLSAAHAKGIIHRDLKPENVFLTSDGRVKILDFGLARWVPVPGSSSAPGAPDLTATQPGIVMGTVAYMSPEQVRGISAGAPSDIFSLGCVLFEMLVGQGAFVRPTAAETIAAILTEDSPRLGSNLGSNVQIPADLERVVAHCLEKEPQQRFQSARDLAFNLRAVGAQPAPPAVLEPRETIESLAVLPFVNAAGTPDTEYLSDGIAESLINTLSQIPRLRVVPRSRAFSFKGQEGDPGNVGRRLNVRALLTGKVMQRGETLNVQVELVDVPRESQLWGERFSRKATDIFTVEDEIAKQISERLRLKLTGPERARLRKRDTKNTDAYHLYLKGRYYLNKRTADGLRRGIEYFHEAVKRDPSYAQTYAGLADGYMVLSFFIPSPARGFAAKGKAAALKALDIDAQLSEALAALGMIQCSQDWAWREAEQSLRRAIELMPDYSLAHDYYAMLLSAQGRHDEAIREVRHGLELEPLSAIVGHHVAWVLIRARMYDEAIDLCREVVEMDPNFPMGYYWLGLTYGLKALYEEAIRALQAVPRSVGTTFTTLELARVYAASGRTEVARQLLADMQETFERDYAEPLGFATACAALGEVDKAFHWLERAFQDRSGFFAMWVNGDPRLDSLRSDARMSDLLRRVGFDSPNR